MYMYHVYALYSYHHHVTWSKGNESPVKYFQFWEFFTIVWELQMLHFDTNPIRIGYLVTELWAIYQCWKQSKTKELRPFLCQYLKNTVCDIGLIPLDHVTYILHLSAAWQWREAASFSNRSANLWASSEIVSACFRHCHKVVCILPEIINSTLKDV